MKTMLTDEQRSRDLLPDEARELARMVLDTAGLSPEHYAQAGQVLRMTMAKPGNRSSMPTDDRWQLHDLMAGQIKNGSSQEDAARFAKEHLQSACRLTERQLINIFKAMTSQEMQPVDSSK
jgi:hypothetical protein